MTQLATATNVAFLGHVDHGKSSLVGRFFFDLNLIKPQIADRLARHAAGAGQPALRFAFFTDTTFDERQRGMSIEPSFRALETKGRRFSVIDLPGHRDFLPAAISGAALSDAVVLTVDAFETLSNGVAPQLLEHIRLLEAFDIKEVIVAVNKVDRVAFSRDAFQECVSRLAACIKAVVRRLIKVHFVPTVAIDGDNIVRPSTRMDWYYGPTLLTLLEAVGMPNAVKGPFRMSILRLYRVRGVGVVLAGRIESGTVACGDEVTLAPFPGNVAVTATVKSIQWHHRDMVTAQSGDDVGISLTHLSRTFNARMVKKGAMLCSLESPAKPTMHFVADVLIANHANGIGVGYSPILHVHQASLPCRIAAIELIGGAGIHRNKIATGMSCRAMITTSRPVIVEPITTAPRLARFILRDSGVVAYGTVSN